MVFLEKSLFNDIEINKLTSAEADKVKALIGYLSDSYVVCEYINDKFLIVRFNADYLKEKFNIDENKKVAVYNSSGQMVLGFNADKNTAEEFYKTADFTKKFLQDEKNSYAVSVGFYGEFTAVTTQSDNKDGVVVGRSFLYFLAFLISVISSVLCVVLFSTTIFKYFFEASINVSSFL